VVETREIRPGFHRVASFAAGARPVGAKRRHLFAEFPAVRVAVASRAGSILKSVRNNFRRISCGRHFVAFRARDCQVRPGEREPALLMLRDGERRRLESVDRVALLALALVRSRGKLPLVNIGVAIHAAVEWNFVTRRDARRDVALRARHARMLSFERIHGRRVLLHREERRLPAVHIVARRAFAFVLARGELAVVRVGRVAVPTFRERDRLLEISSRMAADTIHLRMLSQ